MICGHDLTSLIGLDVRDTLLDSVGAIMQKLLCQNDAELHHYFIKKNSPRNCINCTLSPVYMYRLCFVELEQAIQYSVLA